jgi:outer membrane protein insertion porin family
VKENKRLEVNFQIDEGARYKLGDVVIEGASTFERSELLAPISVQKGEIFDRPALVQDLQEVRSLYWNQGFRTASVEPEVVPDRESGIADLHLRIREGSRFRFRKIRISGVGEAADGTTFNVPLETKDYVIERELTLEPGEILDWSMVEETERRLVNLQFFESRPSSFPPHLKHGFEFEPIPGTRDADLLLQLEETNTGFIQLGGGFSTDFGPSLNLEFKDRNALGRAWEYSFATEVGRLRKSADISFYNPRLNNSDFSTRYRLFANQRDPVGGRQFGETRYGGAIGVGKKLNSEFTSYLEYRLERVEISDVEDTYVLRDPEDDNATLVDKLFSEEPNTTSSVQASLSRDTRDYVFFPMSGYHDVMAVELAGLGGDNKFAQVRGTFDRFMKVREKMVLALRGHFALANPYGSTDQMPLQERFFLGGSNTIRGFRNGGIAPYRIVQRKVTDIDGNEVFEDDEILIGGESEWFSNLELRYRFNETVQSVAFFDAGDVYEEAGDFDLGTTRMSVGSGLRLNLFSNALVRLDLGFPLAEEEQDKKQSFQFNFGASF